MTLNESEKMAIQRILADLRYIDTKKAEAIRKILERK